VLPFDFFTLPLVSGLYKSGEKARANAMAEKIDKNTTEELAYYFSFPDKDLKPMDMSIQEAVFTMQRLNEIVTEAGQDKLSISTGAALKKYYDLYIEKVYQPEGR